MVEELKQWIDAGCNYSSGIAILNTLLKDNKIKKFQFDLCASGRSSYSEKKLKEIISDVIQSFESGKIADTRKVSLPKRNADVAKLKKREKSPNIDFSKLPEDLQSLDREIKDLYGRNRVMKGQLKQLLYSSTGEKRSLRSIYRTKDERELLTNQIASNQKYIDAMWKRIDYFVHTGQRLPGTEPVSEMRQIAIWLRELPQYVNYVRQADSKFRKTGKYTDKELYDHYKSQLSAIQQFIQQFA